ncbi:malonyl-coenzyme:anthocyanin 5-O-glucoside-6'''-O-malonyltransferase-like [Tasmannia lanceolata]|uniref:malonyl-coenzyme:anthocyanin 5-O-glucoside-6'''-O-malonyltransferase-like n=1 Tax=Tasmannia lanceolata TaxID=3420 RepID=UPI0040636677
MRVVLDFSAEYEQILKNEIDLVAPVVLEYQQENDPFDLVGIEEFKDWMGIDLDQFPIFTSTATTIITTATTIIALLHRALGDSVPLTIAESDADFHRLTPNLPRDVTEFHHLVPPLPTPDPENMPLLALQVTIFPNSGICIGMSLHHVGADGCSSIHFMKSWASICRAGGDLSLIKSLPIIDRTVAKGLEEIKRKFFIEMEKVKVDKSLEGLKVKKTQDEDMVRAMFVLTRADLESLKQWVSARVDPSWETSQYSSFVLTCTYVWICLVKVRKVVGEKRVHFVLAMDFRARLDPPLGSEYLGNCIGACFAESNGSDLSGENRLVVGLEAIRRAIRGMEDNVLKDAELWILKFLSLSGELVISVAGSPRFRVYDTDFGWGRPKKVEVISIGGTGAMSLAESRDQEGGLEVGVVLPKHEMVQFASLFEEGLKVCTC